MRHARHLVRLMRSSSIARVHTPAAGVLIKTDESSFWLLHVLLLVVRRLLLTRHVRVSVVLACIHVPVLV